MQKIFTDGVGGYQQDSNEADACLRIEDKNGFRLLPTDDSAANGIPLGGEFREPREGIGPPEGGGIYLRRPRDGD